VADLPWAQIPVQWSLHLRRFFCDQPLCPRSTFAEPLPELVARSARRSLRLAAEQRQLGCDLGGEAAARTAQRQGMPISPDTLLCLVRRTSAPPAPTPRVVGVDDWAKRKGQTYGSIIVDLDTHRPIDLLPDRTAETLATWLKEHPGVQVISRDRAGAYSDGATRGAPDAVQVADRFHLLSNLREALERMLDRHQTALQAAAVSLVEPPLATETPPTTTSLAPHGDPPPAPLPLPATSPASAAAALATQPRPRADQERQVRRARRQERYAAVLELHQHGLSLRAIARQLHISRKTVQRYLAAGSFPERATPPPQPSLLDPYLPYLRQQLEAGHENGMQLWRDIRAQGYSGSHGLVSRWVTHHRHLCPPAGDRPNPARRGRPPGPPAPLAPAATRRLSARQAAWLLIRQPKELANHDDRAVLTRLLEGCPDVATAYPLTQAFVQMVRDRTPEALLPWLEQLHASGIPELNRFATGLERDQAAVQAALALPYSNGPVEGQITRLKLIKRSMYGRANFDLLRARVLAA
jgi:transposase